MSEPLTEAALLRSLHTVRDPEFDKTLVDLHELKDAVLKDVRAEIAVELPTPAYPQSSKDKIAGDIKTALTAKYPELKQVDVKFPWKVKGKNTGGTIGLRVKNVVAVGSGKGGVGKSTMAASLAYGLNHYGAKVGLLDADVYGPSIPHMLNIHGQPEVTEPQPGLVRIKPHEMDGIKVQSIGFFVRPEQAIVWRGPMLHKTLTQFLKDTEWGDLDYLIIDMPPGTGDVSLTLSQLLGLAGAVVVCTPQKVALLDAVRAIDMFRQVRIPVLGMIENMTGDIFGRGGAKTQAEQMSVPFLGEVPTEAQIRIQGDEGKISALFKEGNPAREPLLYATERMAIEIARTLLNTPTMPTLEIL
jgi:ATP-binding protein involved in chromosome partitioning